MMVEILIKGGKFIPSLFPCVLCSTNVYILGGCNVRYLKGGELVGR